jgi:phosphoglycerate-specific signal transduction histidine kinase
MYTQEEVDAALNAQMQMMEERFAAELSAELNAQKQLMEERFTTELNAQMQLMEERFTAERNAQKQLMEEHFKAELTAQEEHFNTRVKALMEQLDAETQALNQIASMAATIADLDSKLAKANVEIDALRKDLNIPAWYTYNTPRAHASSCGMEANRFYKY